MLGPALPWEVLDIVIFQIFPFKIYDLSKDSEQTWKDIKGVTLVSWGFRKSAMRNWFRALRLYYAQDVDYFMEQFWYAVYSVRTIICRDDLPPRILTKFPRVNSMSLVIDDVETASLIRTANFIRNLPPPIISLGLRGKHGYSPSIMQVVAQTRPDLTNLQIICPGARLHFRDRFRDRFDLAPFLVSRFQCLTSLRTLYLDLRVEAFLRRRCDTEDRGAQCEECDIARQADAEEWRKQAALDLATLLPNLERVTTAFPFAHRNQVEYYRIRRDVGKVKLLPVYCA